MDTKTLVMRSTAVILTGILCLGPCVASFAADVVPNEVAVGDAAEVSPRPASFSGAPRSKGGVGDVADKAKNAGTDAGKADGASAEPRKVERKERHWSLVNLVSVLFNLFVALGLIARLAFIILRDESYEQRLWERAKNPRTLDDVRMASALYNGRLDDIEEFEEFAKRPTAFDQFCASACAVLALVGLVLFFIVADLSTPMVIFDDLSPLFGVITVLILLGMTLSLLSARRTARQGAGRDAEDEWDWDNARDWEDARDLRDAWAVVDVYDASDARDVGDVEDVRGVEGVRDSAERG